MAITYRSVKGSALTHTELDGNFTDLVAADVVLTNAVALNTARTQVVEAASTASTVAGGQWVSDGAGGGEFIRINGWAEFADSRVTNASPSQVLTSGVASTWVINGTLLSNEKNPSDATVSMWNTSTNKIVPISLEDVYTLRIDFIAEGYTGHDKFIEIQLHDNGGGSDVIIQRTFSLLKNGTAVLASAAFPIHANSSMITNGGSFTLTLNGSGTCNIHSSRIFISRDQKAYV